MKKIMTSVFIFPWTASSLSFALKWLKQMHTFQELSKWLKPQVANTAGVGSIQGVPNLSMHLIRPHAWVAVFMFSELNAIHGVMNFINHLV